MTAIPIRLPITIAILREGYTGAFHVGPSAKPINVLLDTGSSNLVVGQRTYDPQQDAAARSTRLVQDVQYADHSGWRGSIVKTVVSFCGQKHTIALSEVHVAVAYCERSNPFGTAEGILGLAYRPLDDARRLLPGAARPKCSEDFSRHSRATSIEPYFMQLERAGQVANKFAFYTRRSRVRASIRALRCRMNLRWLISSPLTGQGTDQLAHRTGSSAAHCARSR